eukprot:gene19717-34845_t
MGSGDPFSKATLATMKSLKHPKLATPKTGLPSMRGPHLRQRGEGCGEQPRGMLPWWAWGIHGSSRFLGSVDPSTLNFYGHCAISLCCVLWILPLHLLGINLGMCGPMATMLAAALGLQMFMLFFAIVWLSQPPNLLVLAVIGRRSLWTACKNLTESPTWSKFNPTWKKLKEREMEVLRQCTLLEIMLGFVSIFNIFFMGLPAALSAFMQWSFLKLRYQSWWGQNGQGPTKPGTLHHDPLGAACRR